MDKIFLRALEVETVIGVWEWERRIKQTVVIDLEMAADIRTAAAADDIESTFDYRRIAKRVIAFVEASSFQLVETLAEKIAEILIGEFGLSWTRVSVNKPGAIRGARDVGVLIERTAEDYPGQ